MNRLPLNSGSRVDKLCDPELNDSFLALTTRMLIFVLLGLLCKYDKEGYI